MLQRYTFIDKKSGYDSSSSSNSGLFLHGSEKSKLCCNSKNVRVIYVTRLARGTVSVK